MALEQRRSRCTRVAGTPSRRQYHWDRYDFSRRVDSNPNAGPTRVSERPTFGDWASRVERAIHFEEKLQEARFRRPRLMKYMCIARGRAKAEELSEGERQAGQDLDYRDSAKERS
jgi:hypothetical protein